MNFIETTKGKMPESALEKKTGVVETVQEQTEWVEYWFKGELVHRSAHVTIKKMPAMAESAAGKF